MLCCLALLRFTREWRLWLAAVTGLVFAGGATAATEPRLLGVTGLVLAVIALGWLFARRRVDPPVAPL